MTNPLLQLLCHRALLGFRIPVRYHCLIPGSGVSSGRKSRCSSLFKSGPRAAPGTRAAALSCFWGIKAGKHIFPPNHLLWRPGEVLQFPIPLHPLFPEAEARGCVGAMAPLGYRLQMEQGQGGRCGCSNRLQEPTHGVGRRRGLAGAGLDCDFNP